MKGRAEDMKNMKKTVMFMVIAAFVITLGYLSNHSAHADDIIDNPWKELLEQTTNNNENPESTTAEVEETTKDSNNPTNGKNSKDIKPGKTVIVKVEAKKKSAKKVKLLIKRVKNASGYQVRFFVKKAFAKRNKKTIVKKTFRKNVKTLIIKSKKLKGKDKLFVKVRAFKLDAKENKIFGAWSKIKKVRIK